MNIAIINTTAKSGSTGKIAFAFYNYIKSTGNNAYIFYGRNDDQVTPEDKELFRVGTNIDLFAHGILSRISGMQGCYSKRPTIRMIQKFEELNIQAVCMFNIHGYYLNYIELFRYLGRKRIPCEYVMLDEYPFLGKCTYSFDCNKYTSECKKCPRLHDYPKSFFYDSSTRLFWLKKKLYKMVPQCVFVGIQYTVEKAKKSAVTKNCKFAIADEAIDLRNMYYPRNIDRLRKKHGIPKTNKVILTVCPYPNKRKGGEYFLEAAKRLADHKDITFVHVGFQGDKSECPDNYIAIGYIKDQNLLSEYYSLADLFVHTSLAETIPSAILEALACGTPVLGFASSGIPYSADKEHGVFVEPRNVNEMIEVIKRTPLKNEESIKSCRLYAESRYDSIEYGRKLLSILEKKDNTK